MAAQNFNILGIMENTLHRLGSEGPELEHDTHPTGGLLRRLDAGLSRRHLDIRLDCHEYDGEGSSFDSPFPRLCLCFIHTALHGYTEFWTLPGIV